jgi:hypothetical protein
MISGQFDGLDLQERDSAILRGLFESRMMTAAHIAQLHFDGKAPYATKRLQKLKAAGLIGEQRRRVFERAILFLTRKGLDVLHQNGTLTEYPPISRAGLEKRSRVSELMIRHELEIMDVKAAFHTALAASEVFSLNEFSTWPLLYQFQARPGGYGSAERLVKPDGFVRIHENEPDGGLSERAFFLEVDRSTETLDRLVAQANCYLDYYKSGGFAERHGAPRSAFREYPFRVLLVLKTLKRLHYVAERLLQCLAPITSQVCLSTIQEVTTNPLAAIWTRPVDYREAARGTLFDPDLPRQERFYRRPTERENLIATRIRKWRLFDDVR